MYRILFPHWQILDPSDPSKLKECADNNYEFDEDCGKFSERLENAVGKGEIARNEQILLFPQGFQRLVPKTCTKKSFFREGEENIVGKEKMLLTSNSSFPTKVF